MFKKDEEKNKVGRPKLADSETKKKSIITLSIALVFAVALVIGGTFSLFGGFNTSKLSASATEKYVYSNLKKTNNNYSYCKYWISNITTNDATLNWWCYRNKSAGLYISNVTAQGSGANRTRDIVMNPWNGNKKVSWILYDAPGKLKSNTTYYASLTFHDSADDWRKQKPSALTFKTLKTASKKTPANKTAISCPGTINAGKSVTCTLTGWSLMNRSSSLNDNNKNCSLSSTSPTKIKVSCNKNATGSVKVTVGGMGKSKTISIKKTGSGNTKPNTTTRYSSGENNYVATTSRTTTTTTKKLGKCEISVKGGKSVTYSISCKDGAKFKKGYVNISDEIKKIKSLKGTVTPELTNFRRNGHVTIVYNNGSKDVKLNSKSFVIDNIKDYQNQCLKSGIKDANTACGKHRYHIVSSSTYCRSYAYKDTSGTKLSMKCGSNAAPLKTELYEVLSNGKYKLVFKDTNWLRNYGFVSDKAYEQRIAKLVSKKKIVKGKKYMFRIMYTFNDRTDGKNSKTSETLVHKVDNAKITFTYGDTKLSGLNEQISKKSEYYYNTNEFKNNMTNDDKCKVTASLSGKNIKYSIECGKYAYPGSLRIVTKYGEKYKNDSAYAKKINITHKINYLNGKTTSNTTESDNGGTIRTMFGAEAKENGTTVYGMKEDGTIIGVDSKRTYNLVLYYGFKNSKVSTATPQVKARSNSVAVK